MPVELTITETSVILESSSEPGPAGPGVATGGTTGQALVKNSNTDYDTKWATIAGVGGSAPDAADYLVGTANGDLSAEIVVGTTPGGELGGTWGSPTVDASHSGSTHAAVQAAAEATAASALSSHVGAADPHTGYRLESAAIVSADIQDGTIVVGDLAFDPATQAELDAHINDVSDAHDASAVSFTPNGSIAATDVQAAIQEVRDEAGSSTALTVKEDGAVVDATVTTIDFLGADFDVTESPEDEVNVVIAAAIARQAALDAHINDTTDAHDASAISIADAGNDFTATDVEGALDELQADAEVDATALSDHIADTADAHDASAISVVSTTLSGTGVDVQAVFEELDNLLDDHSARHENGGADEISIAGLDGTPVELTSHLNDTVDAHDASAISNVAAGGIAATDVQAALNELDTEKTTLAQVTTELADQKRVLEVIVTDPNGSAITTGDGKAHMFIPTLLGGHNLVAAHAGVTTVSSSGTPTIQIANVTQAADMLSTRITIDASEKTSYTAAAAPVIDAANDDVATGDELRIDVDVAGTGTKGLIVMLTFEAP